MKTLAQIALAWLLILPLRGAEASAYRSESTLRSEVFISKIEKVYSFPKDGRQHVAYVVHWQDHEVVISPNGYSAEEAGDCQVGETVRCRMLQQAPPPGTEDRLRGLIAFSIIGPVRSRSATKEKMEPVARETGKRPATRGPEGMSPDFTAKVLKVYSFKEDNHKYVAYVVTWQNVEVVAFPTRPSLATYEYKAGDTIHCLMQQAPPRPGREHLTNGLISFGVVAPSQGRTKP